LVSLGVIRAAASSAEGVCPRPRRCVTPEQVAVVQGQHCATPIGTVTVPSFPARPVTARVTQAQRLTMMAPK
jgi:hypothetical protein